MRRPFVFVFLLVVMIALTACGDKKFNNTKWELVEEKCDYGGLGDIVVFHEKNKATIENSWGQIPLDYEKVSKDEYVFSNQTESHTFKLQRKGDELRVMSLNDDGVCLYKQLKD